MNHWTTKRTREAVVDEKQAKKQAKEAKRKEAKNEMKNDEL